MRSNWDEQRKNLVMMRHVNKFGGVILATTVLALSAGSGAAETLQEALVAAYSSNPTLQAERARLRGTDEGVAQARSGWRPTITLSADYGQSERRSASTRGFLGFGLPIVVTNKTYTEDYSTGAVMTQPLFRGFRTINSTKEAKARVRAGRADLWTIEQQVLLDAVAAYRDVIRDGATIELNENNVRVLQRQLEASEDRFRVGEITRTDVAQATARLSLSKSNLSQARAVLAESRARYQVVIGQAPGSLDAIMPLPNLPAGLKTAIALALDNNPGLISARENEEAAKYSVSVQKGGLLPSVNIQVQYRQNEETARKKTQSTNYSVAAQASLPLYQGGAQYSRIRQAKEGYSQARIQVAERRRAVIGSTTTAWENLVAATATIESDKEQVRANEIAFDGVQQEAQVGSRTTLDVLDAEQELLNAQVALVRSQREEFVAAYQLLSAVGTLTAEDLGLPVDLYDPEVNYEAVDGKWIGFGTTSD